MFEENGFNVRDQWLLGNHSQGPYSSALIRLCPLTQLMFVLWRVIVLKSPVMNGIGQTGTVREKGCHESVIFTDFHFFLHLFGHRKIKQTFVAAAATYSPVTTALCYKISKGQT